MSLQPRAWTNDPQGAVDGPTVLLCQPEVVHAMLREFLARVGP